MYRDHVLAIDPGSRNGLGWALMDFERNLIEHGEIKVEGLEANDRSKLWREVWSLLACFAHEYAPIVVYERVYKHSGINAAHIYGGQIAVIQVVCRLASLEWQHISIQAGKKALGHKASGKEKETVAVAAAHKLGYTTIQGPNEADALGLALAYLDAYQSS